MGDHNQYVILEWVRRLPGFPRYSFATIKHAEELWPEVRWLQSCPSLDLAAETASVLNFRHASTGVAPGDVAGL